MEPMTMPAIAPPERWDAVPVVMVPLPVAVAETAAAVPLAAAVAVTVVPDVTR
jgi:hypothetical protein